MSYYNLSQQLTIYQVPSSGLQTSLCMLVQPQSSLFFYYACLAFSLQIVQQLGSSHNVCQVASAYTTLLQSTITNTVATKLCCQVASEHTIYICCTSLYHIPRCNHAWQRECCNHPLAKPETQQPPNKETKTCHHLQPGIFSKMNAHDRNF